MSQVAASFLRRCFASDETIVILLRRQDDTPPKQRVVRLEQVLDARYMTWLSYENQHGRSNIYVAANPLRPGSHKRTKQCIESIRHLYLDIDDVITILETRRRFELPAALCSARAKEIAATAQRMIAHRKSA